LYFVSQTLKHGYGPGIGYS